MLIVCVLLTMVVRICLSGIEAGGKTLSLVNEITSACYSGEDNTLLLWDMQAAQPETLSLPFPTPSSSSSSPPSSPGLLLPVLAQSVSTLC